MARRISRLALQLQAKFQGSHGPIDRPRVHAPGSGVRHSASESDSSSTALPFAQTLTATPRPCGDEAAIEAVRPSVVRVSTDSSVGTGIIVAEYRILTRKGYILSPLREVGLQVY